VGPSLGPTRMHPDHEHLRRLEARRVRAPRGRGDAASAQGTKKPRLGRASDGRRFGKPPKPHEPPATPQGEINLTDPDSRLMKGTHSYLQGYNAQAAVNDTK